MFGDIYAIAKFPKFDTHSFHSKFDKFFLLLEMFREEMNF